MATADRFGVEMSGPERGTVFEHGGLRFHVVTATPLTDFETRSIQRLLPRSTDVELFAAMVSTLLGRHVRVRDERPDIWIEVGR